jgi:hypothetical protein
LADLDRTHNLVVSYSYDLPFGPEKRFARSRNPVVRRLVGGWKVAASHNYMSGAAISVSSDQRNPLTFGSGWVNIVPGAQIRPSYNRNMDPNDPSRRFLNVAAFTVPAANTFGNTRLLSTVRDNPFFNENITLIKQFEIKEQTRFEFGMNLFNAFNRHMLTNLQTNIQNSAFGRFSRASNPRWIQVYLRLGY